MLYVENKFKIKNLQKFQIVGAIKKILIGKIKSLPFVEGEIHYSNASQNKCTSLALTSIDIQIDIDFLIKKQIQVYGAKT